MDLVHPGDPLDLATAARDIFTRTFGASPAVVTRAPGRINLIGEHTDYNGGTCLPLALPHATYAAARERSDDLVRIVSVEFDETWVCRLADLEQASGWAAYAAGTLWATGLATGVDLAIVSTVPTGAGLSSSAALECAVAVAADSLAGRVLTPQRRVEIAAACVRAETEVAGAPTGGMDQLVAMLAPAGDALLIDFSDDSTRSVMLPLYEVGLELLVIDTGVRHALADGSYAQRRAECEAAASALGVTHLASASLSSLARDDTTVPGRRARHVITECARVADFEQAVVEGEWTEAGAILDASHASLRDDFEVSCPELDIAVDRSRAAGALGARMTGGGFGGSAIALVPSDDVQQVATAVADAYAEHGWAPPRFLVGGPSEPAGVLSPAE